MFNILRDELIKDRLGAGDGLNFNENNSHKTPI